ncbi:MAG: hypothetical protein Q8P41_09840 [Pseudomonadota bacterium]|nr:hypothetical protein [Pseudomonadota bacterium]
MEDREVARAVGRAGLLALPALMGTVRNCVVPVEQIVGRVPDDALFYLVVARRLAAGEGFTFDGVAPTTGFHPLWAWLVAAGVPTADPVRGLGGLLALHGVAVVASVLLLERALARVGVGAWRRGLGAAAAGAWGASAYGLGMETALVSALALAAVNLGLDDRSRGVPAGLVGLAMGLTRVDALPLLLGAGRRAPSALAGGILGVLLTLGFNRAVAGEWGSTAAHLKALGTVAARLQRLDPGVVWRHAPGPAVAAAIVIGVAYASRLRTGGRGGPVLPSPFIGALVGGLGWLAASYLLNNLVGPWYHLPLAWLLIAGALVAAERLHGRIVGGVLTAALLVALLRGVALPTPGLHGTVVAFARELSAHTPPEARILAEDFPGAIAWFGERTVLPADGLAASPGYREALTTGTALSWWTERGATHYAVTRRRAPWLHTKRLHTTPLLDHIAPPFLPVPPSPVPLDPAALVVEEVDVGSDRLFALYRL